VKKRLAHDSSPAKSAKTETSDFTGPLFLYCAHARDAAAHGRFRAAHGLFQSAVLFFDRAQSQMNSPDQTQELAPGFLVAARAELDDCARSVYPVADAPQVNMRPRL